jgi:hypothetical protein
MQVSPASLLNALAHLLLRRSATPDGLNNPKTAACRLDAVGATRLKRLTIRAFNIRVSSERGYVRDED